jgi:hypothetical protein
MLSIDAVPKITAVAAVVGRTMSITAVLAHTIEALKVRGKMTPSKICGRYCLPCGRNGLFWDHLWPIWVWPIWSWADFDVPDMVFRVGCGYTANREQRTTLNLTLTPFLTLIHDTDYHGGTRVTQIGDANPNNLA